MLKDAETFRDFAGRANKRVNVGVGWKDGSSSNEGSPFSVLVDHWMEVRLTNDSLATSWCRSGVTNAGKLND